jgi:deferrochelatase/peroxidase EfeB
LNDDEALGNEPLANNHFRFDSDAEALPLTSGFVDKHPQSKADPAGITCPWAAHIRKVNTRDSASDTGGRDSTYIRRILRVGIPYGKPLTDGDADVKFEKDKKSEEDPYVKTESQPDKDDRGLLFLSIQASIEDQFEFLVTRWMGDPSRPKMPAGHDIVVGQNDAAGEHRERRCVLFGSGLQQATVTTNAQWIVPTGGGYFFVPSLSALRGVLGGM